MLITMDENEFALEIEKEKYHFDNNKEYIDLIKTLTDSVKTLEDIVSINTDITEDKDIKTANIYKEFFDSYLKERKEYELENNN